MIRLKREGRACHPISLGHLLDTPGKLFADTGYDAADQGVPHEESPSYVIFAQGMVVGKHVQPFKFYRQQPSQSSVDRVPDRMFEPGCGCSPFRCYDCPGCLIQWIGKAHPSFIVIKHFTIAFLPGFVLGSFQILPFRQVFLRDIEIFRQVFPVLTLYQDISQCDLFPFIGRYGPVRSVGAFHHDPCILKRFQSIVPVEFSAQIRQVHFRTGLKPMSTKGGGFAIIPDRKGLCKDPSIKNPLCRILDALSQCGLLVIRQDIRPSPSLWHAVIRGVYDPSFRDISQVRQGL